MNIDTIYIWTDGSCNNKTKRNGAYGIVMKYKEHEKLVSGGQFINSTSARCELHGALNALRLVIDKTKRVELYCDNQYVTKSVSENWLIKWESELWLTGQGEDNLKYRTNHDLLKQLLAEIRKFPAGFVKFIHLKGHNGDINNEIADRLAAEGGKSEKIIDDSYSCDFHKNS